VTTSALRLRSGLLLRPWVTFPQAPVVIPDGRFSRVRLAGGPPLSRMAFPTRWLRRRLACTTAATGSPYARHAFHAIGVTGLRVPRRLVGVPAKSESPFAPFRCGRSEGDVSHHLTGRYPSVRHYGLMRRIDRPPVGFTLGAGRLETGKEYSPTAQKPAE